MQPAPTPPAFPGHPADAHEPADMRYFSLLDAMQVGMT
jgi:hypothetical protein